MGTPLRFSDGRVVIIPRDFPSEEGVDLTRSARYYLERASRLVDGLVTAFEDRRSWYRIHRNTSEDKPRISDLICDRHYYVLGDVDFPGPCIPTGLIGALYRFGCRLYTREYEFDIRPSEFEAVREKFARLMDDFCSTRECKALRKLNIALSLFSSKVRCSMREHELEVRPRLCEIDKDVWHAASILPYQARAAAKELKVLEADTAKQFKDGQILASASEVRKSRREERSIVEADKANGTHRPRPRGTQLTDIQKAQVYVYLKLKDMGYKKLGDVATRLVEYKNWGRPGGYRKGQENALQQAVRRHQTDEFDEEVLDIVKSCGPRDLIKLL